MHCRGIGILVIAPFVMASDAMADSDGWYCHGPGYIAYELQFSMGVAAHELHIVRVGGGRIVEPVMAPLEIFQVHGMTCGVDTITISGFDTRHTVDMTRSPPWVTTTAGAGQSHQPVAQNLGHWSESGVVEIASDDPDYRYQLVIAKAEHRQDDADGAAIEHFTHTQIWQRARDASGRVFAVLPLFHGIFEETVD